MKWLIRVLFLLVSFGAHALQLPQFPDAPVIAVAITPGQQPIACDEVLDRLTELNQKNSQYDLAFASFLGETQQRFADTYTALQGFEGQTETFKVGTFKPILKAADEMAKVTEASYNANALLAGERELIVESLRQCLEAVRTSP